MDFARGAVALISAAALRPKTAPSKSEFDARRFAPWTPLDATSPTAKSPGIVVCPTRSVQTPPFV